jgi:hypothetical protein
MGVSLTFGKNMKKILLSIIFGGQYLFLFTGVIAFWLLYNPQWIYFMFGAYAFPLLFGKFLGINTETQLAAQSNVPKIVECLFKLAPYVVGLTFGLFLLKFFSLIIPLIGLVYFVVTFGVRDYFLFRYYWSWFESNK